MMDILLSFYGYPYCRSGYTYDISSSFMYGNDGYTFYINTDLKNIIINNNMTEYNCKICNKKYASYKSYWNHNKNFHINNDNIEIIKYKCKYCNKTFKCSSNMYEHQRKVCEKKLNNNIENIKYKCKYCNKEFNNSSNMYKHQKKVCEVRIKNNENTTNTNINITNNTNINNSNSNNNNITNNITNNNNIIINSIGNENINDLSDLEIKNILTNIYDSIHKLIENLNFNERLPQNHSFCSTALNSPYISVYDTSTNKINKEKKTYLFRKLVDNSIIKIQQIFNNNKKKIKEKQRKMIEEELNAYANIHNIITNEKYKKNIFSNINLTSYNKKDIILKTWDEIKNNPIFNHNVKERTFEEEMDEFFIIEREEYLNSLSDSDSSIDNINNILKSKIIKK